MANMSYCRFQNTLNDLQDCFDNFTDELNSTDEEEAREEMLKLCKQIAKYKLSDLPKTEEEED